MTRLNQMGWMITSGVGTGDFASRLYTQSVFDGAPLDEFAPSDQTDFSFPVTGRYAPCAPPSPGIQERYLHILRKTPPEQAATIGLPLEGYFDEEDSKFCKDFLSYMATLGHIGSVPLERLRINLPQALKLGVLHRSKRRAEQIAVMQECAVVGLLRLAGALHPIYTDFVRKFVRSEVTTANDRSVASRKIRGYVLPFSNPPVCLDTDGEVRLLVKDRAFSPCPTAFQKLDEMRNKCQIIETHNRNQCAVDGYSVQSSQPGDRPNRFAYTALITRITNRRGASAKDYLAQLAQTAQTLASNT